MQGAAGVYEQTGNPGDEVQPGMYAFTRREVIGAGVAGFGASLLSACGLFKSIDAPDAPLMNPFITVTVTSPKANANPTIGLSVPISSPTTEAFLYVPSGYTPAAPAPLLLMFHAENQTAFSAVSLFQPYADAAGLVLLAVDSAGATWDIIADQHYGTDLQFASAALAAVFNEVNIDPARVGVEGYSEGGSYALAIGRTNGNLFSHVIAFAPDFMPSYSPSGIPKFFMAQGIQDTVFDITETGDVINAGLTAAGYTVDYVRFTGDHLVPGAIVQQAIAWLAT